MFELLGGKVFVNIEMKGPHDPVLKNRYSWQLAAKLVGNTVNKHNMHGKFLISSFNKEMLTEVELMRARYEVIHPRFDIIYLYNYQNAPLPSWTEYTWYGDGINVSSNYINEEVVSYCRRLGKKVGVWIRDKTTKEDEEFY